MNADNPQPPGFSSGLFNSYPPRSAAASVPSAGLTALFLNLMKVTHDGENGFQHAAAHVHDRALRDEFHKYARERRSMASELSHLMNLAGEEVVPSTGSTTAMFHRSWMSLRTALSEEPDDQSILDEVERGENAAEEAFEEALQPAEQLPETVRFGIQSLAQKVHRAHDRVRRLRDSGLYQKLRTTGKNELTNPAAES